MKQSITANNLAFLAFQELHAFPGTEYITSACIEDSWVLMVSAKAGADLGRIQTAVREIERYLRQRYILQGGQWITRR
jgi:hypothetical protein